MPKPPPPAKGLKLTRSEAREAYFSLRSILAQLRCSRYDQRLASKVFQGRIELGRECLPNLRRVRDYLEDLTRPHHPHV